MKKTIVIIRIILACLCIFFAFNALFTVGFSNPKSGFNYGSLLIFSGFLFSGILALVKRNAPFEMKRLWMLLWAVLVAGFAILIVTVISQHKEIEKIKKIEQSTPLNK